MTRRRGVLAKARDCSAGELMALAEAFVLITLAAPAVRLLAFTRLGRLASLPLRHTPPAPEERRAIGEMVAWAVWVTAKRSWLRSLCFERGLTAQLMLRRRGVDSTLHYGLRNVRRGDGGLAIEGHVWVLDEGRAIMGAENADEYRLMASFPDRRGDARCLAS